MANPIMKVICTNKANPLYGLTGIGHVRFTQVIKHITGTATTDLAFCVQIDNTSHELSTGWHVQNRQDWSNTDAKRPQTQDQRRPNRRTNGNMENER